LIKEDEPPLAPFRVLDLTDERGFLAGKILADLGADVIKIEKVGGDASRSIGPFYHDAPDPEKSLYWFAFNNNKRGITLNIGTAAGQRIFNKLVMSSHFVIESFAPGYMDSLGIGYEMLSKINPRIVMTSITPFGQTGPYKDYKGPDIVCMAMSTLMHFCGDIDRPPVRVSFPQAYLHAGAQAALGTMVAHYYRETSGEGQHVDVSVQESVRPTTFVARFFWEFKKEIRQRSGPYRQTFGKPTFQRQNYPCKDGYIAFFMFGGQQGARTNQGTTEWMDSERLAPDSMKNMDWNEFDLEKVTQDELDEFTGALSKFFMRHTKEELYEGARKRRIMLFPVNTAREIAHDPQLLARKFWLDLEHPELGTTITYPGAFVKLSKTPCKLRWRAPLIGEHNEEIYRGELGFSSEEIIVLKQANVI